MMRLLDSPHMPVSSDHMHPKELVHCISSGTARHSALLLVCVSMKHSRKGIMSTQ